MSKTNLGTILAIGLVLWGAASQWTGHLRDADRRDEKIRVIERIIYSEHPEYSILISGTDK